MGRSGAGWWVSGDSGGWRGAGFDEEGREEEGEGLVLPGFSGRLCLGESCAGMCGLLRLVAWGEVFISSHCCDCVLFPLPNDK